MFWGRHYLFFIFHFTYIFYIAKLVYIRKKNVPLHQIKSIKIMEATKKYKLTSETIEIDGTILHRIKALKDFSDVKAGDLGGWIEKEENLSQIGNAWIGGNAQVYDSVRVFGNAKVCDNAKVFEAARVYGNAKVYCDAEVCGNEVIHNKADFYKNKY